MERGRGGGVALLSEDLLQNILSRLPALSFANAGCVSRSWRRAAGDVLSRPKLASAISLNPSFQDAVKEVLDSVLSRPIRPHFAIACIGLKFSLERTHKLITKKLGSATPVITSVARGIIGSDAITEEFKEVKWGVDVEDFNLPANKDRGIVLIVGFMPGLKVDAIPLLRELEEPGISLIDKFVMDIRNFSAAVSGCTSPTGIVMFGDKHADMKPVLEKMDYAMSMETVILGEESGHFMYRSGDDSRNISGSLKNSCDGVALVFARDNDKPQGVGETQFHVALSTGVVPVGPTHKAASVKVKGDGSERSTWLTARKEGLKEALDGERLLHDIYDEMENENASHDLYIGVTKRRKCSIGSEKVRWVTTLEFHDVLGGDEEYLFVDGVGIKTGDPFRFYRSDSDTALSSCRHVSEEFRNLKQAWTHKNSYHFRGVADGGDKTEVCGGIIFSCYGRGDSFFGQANVDSSPFLENFPGFPLAGIMCGGEIGRVHLSSADHQGGQEESSPRSYLHYYSTVYLVISHTPSSLES
ncbi:hypothetical protein VitviT2T_025661 [Vitis vinifera]|uniref:F-box/LRR-repeat protein n=2 Tax=Vitis vinifera TaxID=29760 RepID=A0ABY9DLF1_VITVI|eukprot:XP_002283895.2 PREDICTED: F-box/LRR-repeat protein At5g63520 [Vitis vinifera]